MRAEATRSSSSPSVAHSCQATPLKTLFENWTARSESPSPRKDRRERTGSPHASGPVALWSHALVQGKVLVQKARKRQGVRAGAHNVTIEPNAYILYRCTRTFPPPVSLAHRRGSSRFITSRALFPFYPSPWQRGVDPLGRAPRRRSHPRGAHATVGVTIDHRSRRRAMLPRLPA